MADKNLEPRSGGVRVKAGVLPGVREIRRPDFTKKAADIEKAEAERVLKQGEKMDDADAAAVKASLEAQESAPEEEKLYYWMIISLRKRDMVELAKKALETAKNTLDEEFRADMDRGSTIEMRLAALKALHESGVYTVCFISPVFPGITDAPAIIERVTGICDEVYLEHLVLQNPYKGSVLYYIRTKYSGLYPYYDRLFNLGQLDEWWKWDDYMEEWCKENGYEYSYEHFPKEHRSKPVITNFRGHKGK